jgi:hypothetical protein
MPDEKRRPGKKVNAWISDDLYYKVDDLKYRTWTEAIVAGLELLVKSTDEVHDAPQESTGKVHDEVRRSTPDDSEILRAQLVENERHIETLQLSLEQANKDKDYLKETHKNYMIQVQTIINNENKQLQIEAPGTKKPWYKFW